MDWNLTLLSFFVCGPFVLKYADSSNPRDFSSRFTCSTNKSNQNSRLRGTGKKPSQQEQTLFLQSSFLFLRAFVSYLLNEKAMIQKPNLNEDFFPQ